MAKIGIVGGGIAGLYCAWKLVRDLVQNHGVTLYEALDRWGGRIETKPLQNFKAECGPMRFELDIEPHFSQLARELGIGFVKFPRTDSGIAEYPKYDLASNEFSAQQRRAVTASGKSAAPNSFSHLTSTLDLLKYGIYRIFQQGPTERALALSDVVADWDGVGTRPSDRISQYAKTLLDDVGLGYDHIRTRAKLDKVRLYTLGFWNALSRVLSPAAVAKIRDTGTFYHLMPENPSASEWSIFWLRLFRPNADLWTVKAGVETIVDNLKDRLEKEGRLKLRKETTVTRIDSLSVSQQPVLFCKGSSSPEGFDHVIFAIPAAPLRAFSSYFPQYIQHHLKGVIPFPLLKAFVVIKKPWWGKLPAPQHGAHLVPTREVHYFDPPTPPYARGMIMFYMDRPATVYWQPFVAPRHHAAQIRRPDALKHELALHASRLLPNDDGRSDDDHVQRVEDSIIDFAIRDWSKPPFGAACHAWRPKINVPRALNELKAFALVTGGKPNVHICGEAYSDYQGFIEGSLRSAKAVVDTI